MSNKENLNDSSIKVDSGEGFDLKELFTKIYNNWGLFAISIAIFFTVGLLYFRYGRPSYNINSMILVQDQSSPGGGGGASSAMGGAGGMLGQLTDVSSLFGIPSNAQNEVELLKSNSLITDVVKKLNLNIVTYNRGWIGSLELFKDSPFDIEVHYKKDSILKRDYDVYIKGDNIHLVDKKDNIDIHSKYGDTIKIDEYDLVLKKTGQPIESRGYRISVQSIEATVEELTKNLDVELTDKQATTISLVFKYSHSKKGEAILHELMELYLKADLEDKVKIADSTISFIDKRLSIVYNQLEGIEKNLEQFKKDNQLADIVDQSKALIESSSDYQKQQDMQQIQLSIVDDLLKYLNDPKNKKIIPSSLATQDAGFADAVEKYNELLLERDRETLSYSESNPVVKNLDTQIENFRANLLNSVESFKKGLLITGAALKDKNGVFASMIKGAPAKERLFLDYTREQGIKEQLYIFLLQRREETAITKTSTISTARIIDDAKSEYYRPVKPKIIVLLVCLFIGFIIPLIYIWLKDLLSIKIITKADIENETNIPIVGEISHNTQNSNIVIDNSARSVIAEQFRALRTNLQYLFKSDLSQVILLTSSMSGEGKTFITSNLAIALGISGKKVILLELDLRKPKLSHSLNLDNQNGFTNYVVSNSVSIDSIIKPIPSQENCFLISSGPVPPNPSELLLSSKLDDLIKELKTRFDYIIIDSAPVGLVSDALLIEKHSDTTLYVVRQNYTYKAQIHIPNNLKQEGKLARPYIIINDINTKKNNYYGYGYGYGYSYGGYADDDLKSKSFLSRFFSNRKHKN